MRQLLLFLAAILAPAFGAQVPYIVGGRDVAPPGKYPWQASLQQGINFLYHNCGASLISARWLVTAAHCVPFDSPDEYRVVLGMHDKDTKLEGQPEMYRVSKVIVHPEYVHRAEGYPYDIALMYLSSNANFTNKYIASIALPSQHEEFVHNPDCHITGWGLLHGGGKSPNVLQEAHVSVYTNSVCKLLLGTGDNIGADQVCASQHGRSGGCNGDSGGPLVCRQDGVWKLVGVTSWGLFGCKTTNPTVYSRVSYVRDWIAEKTGI